MKRKGREKNKHNRDEKVNETCSDMKKKKKYNRKLQRKRGKMDRDSERRKREKEGRRKGRWRRTLKGKSIQERKIIKNDR